MLTKTVVFSATFFLCTLAMATTPIGPYPDTEGVRPDVHRQIVAKFAPGPQRAAVVQTAKALQMALDVRAGDRAAARWASDKMMGALNCVFMQIPPGPHGMHPAQVVKDLEEAMVNTSERKKAYRAYNNAVSGNVSALPEGNTCD